MDRTSQLLDVDREERRVQNPVEEIMERTPTLRRPIDLEVGERIVRGGEERQTDYVVPVQMRQKCRDGDRRAFSRGVQL